MKNITLLTTGGTIASKPNPETGLLSSGALSGEELAGMCELPSDINLTVESVFQIPSNQMNYERLIELQKKVEQILNNSDVDGIVVTHGTDTLEETAYFLDLTINNNKPVVVTGSQRGPTELGTDAMVNIRQAVLAATNEQVKELGVVVLFNERLFSAKYVYKVHASNVDGFSSEGYGYLGIIDQDFVTVYQKPLMNETYRLKDRLPVVDIIPFHTGADDRFIQTSISTGAKGIIIEGSGRGHITAKMAQAVAKATEKGIVVIITTRSKEGNVGYAYDFQGSVFDLTNKGALIGRDYDSKKARLKLAVLLASGATKKEIKESFLS